MNRWAKRLRTAPVQLALFGATYLGAVGFAVVALCLRGYWFEPRVNEKFTPMTEPDRLAVKELQAGPSDARRAELMKTLADPPTLERVYGSWIESGALDGQVVRALAAANPQWSLELAQRTLVVGSPKQRAGATAWLGLLADRPDAQELLHYARRRALRRNEADLLRQVDDVLEQGPTHTPSNPPRAPEE